MRDKISEQRALLLSPKISGDVRKIIEEIEQNKFTTRMAIRVIMGTRTFNEQDGLYALGRTVVNPDGKSLKRPMGNIVTNSKAGQSYHNYGLAIDFAILYDKDNNGTFEALSWDLLKDFDADGEADWLEVVDVFEEHGYTWGGRFNSIKDNPHLEKNFGMHWKELLRLYKAGYFYPGTNFVRI